jgi:flagellar protein FlgJ
MTQQQYNFIKTTLPGAAQAWLKYGVNPIGMMAQAALETGWGKSAPGNMYFGIKATPSWTGKTQTLYTTEYIDGEKKRIPQTFRAYNTPAESFEDYARLIATTSRYKAAMSYPGYYQADKYLEAVFNGGYATDPNYLYKCISIAETIKTIVTEADVIEASKKKA